METGSLPNVDAMTPPAAESANAGAGRRVLFLTSGPHVPSTLYRILPYVPRLRALGFQCDVAHSYPEKYQRLLAIGWRASHVLRGLLRRVDLLQARAKRYDVIVLERELFDDPTWSLEAAFRKTTRRLILDVDDAIFLRYPGKFPRIAGMCDEILAGNRLLAEECRKYCPRVTVVPTAVDLPEYPFSQPRAENAVPVVGWIGTAANLPYLRIALPALDQLAAERRFMLRIVTSDDHELRQLPVGRVNIDFRHWSAATAMEELRQFDVGIMPLPDEPWERYKCGFKLLQYMAAGVPAVASPVGVNCEILSQGENGFLARTTEEWLQSLGRLLEDRHEAAAIRQAARNTIEGHFTIERQLPRVVAALLGNG